MSDIIVTTPKNRMAEAAQEAAACLKAGGGHYFRRLAGMPRDFGPGSKVFYVEDGYIRGYGVVLSIGGSVTGWIDSVGQLLPPGNYAIMPAAEWTWIKPIPMRGFNGWRYFKLPLLVEVVGGWRDPKPEVKP